MVLGQRGREQSVGVARETRGPPEVVLASTTNTTTSQARAQQTTYPLSMTRAATSSVGEKRNTLVLVLMEI